ncbi:bifunctional glucose-1-phosphatase/inositol phosphatase [Candidatus Hartigia pinicola]
MKAKIVALWLFIFMLTPTSSVLASTDNVEDMQLKQILLFSRHNLRTPIVSTSVYNEITDKKWPVWDAKCGHLTTKGGVLEVYMGHYFREWINQNKLFSDEICPIKNKDFFVYTNSLQRTIATAQFFIAGAFPGCSIKIHHRSKIDTIDPLFNMIVTDDSVEFKRKALLAMKKHFQALHLQSSYDELNPILNIKNSKKCHIDQLCNLSLKDNNFIIKKNQEPKILGSLQIANFSIDAINLQYYEGFPLDHVGWGRVDTANKWKKLNILKNSYQKILFSPKIIAKNVAHPLLSYFEKNFTSVNIGNTAKFIMLVGHDSNIASIMSAMNFNPYKLPGQYENTPIGGKLLFQRWYNKKDKKEYVKVEYVYQTADQLRNNSYLSLQKPPKHITLEMKNCPINTNGYCAWKDFQKVIQAALK